MNIGENIKKLRELKSITREQIAAELGITPSGYSKIERNEVDLTISRLQEIAKFIGVDLSHILNFDSSQVFHISHIALSQGMAAKAESLHFHNDNHVEKYIKLLEEKVQKLEQENKSLKQKRAN